MPNRLYEPGNDPQPVYEGSLPAREEVEQLGDTEYGEEELDLSTKSC